MLVRRIQVGDRNRFETHDVKSMVFESPWADIRRPSKSRQQTHGIPERRLFG